MIAKGKMSEQLFKVEVSVRCTPEGAVDPTLYVVYGEGMVNPDEMLEIQGTLKGVMDKRFTSTKTKMEK